MRIILRSLAWSALVLALATGPSSAQADAMSGAGNALEKLAKDLRSLNCANEGTTAQIVMMRRQNGESPTQVIQETTPAGALDVAKAVIAAFAVPRVATKAAFIRSAEEFRNKYELACIDRAD